MKRLLRPASVAIVGASPTRASLGASVLANLERAGYRGEIYLVNPKRTEILGRPCYPSIDALPDNVDCAVLAIPRAGVRDALEACARKGVGSAIIFSSGFAESGQEGRAEQDWIARLARENHMTVQGPNCLGMVNYVDDIALTFVVTPSAKLQPGREGIAIVSQSGAMAAVLIANFAARSVGISYSISTGNEAASGVEDYVEYLIDDPHTRVITMIVEQFRAARRFLKLTERALENGKKIVLLHPGSSGAARASAATHTGAMAGDYMVMRTKVAHAGVILVDTLEQLVDVSELLLRVPSLPRKGAAVLTESGAFKAMALDFCEKIGLELPPFSDGVAVALREVLPDFIPPTNPMDLTAQALVDPGLYKRTLPIIIGDDRFGSMVLAIILTDETTSGMKVPPIIEAIRELSEGSARKPIVFAGMDEGARISQLFVDELRELNVPFFPSPERALQALGIVTRWATAREWRQVTLPAAAPVQGLALTAGVMPEYKSKQVLKELGIAVPSGALALTVQQAISIADKIGYPVVLKAQSAELSHKSDAGGVILNLGDRAALETAWERMREHIDVALDGILVEKMAERGVELIVGARNDKDWGPILMVGLGGVIAEALGDIRLIPPDLAVPAVQEEIFRLKGAALLRGFRDAPCVDVTAAAEVVARVGALMASGLIDEIDINPLTVYSEGEGAVALDALIVAAQTLADDPM